MSYGASVPGEPSGELTERENDLAGTETAMRNSALPGPFQQGNGMHPCDLRGFSSGKEKVCCLRGGECGVDVSGSWNPALRRHALQHHRRVSTRFIHY